MTRNLLVLCPPGSCSSSSSSSVAARVACLAAEAGTTLGLVHTAIDPTRQKASGGRIEELRSFGAHTFHAFDEPLCVGSAIAQLAGYADAVVVERLEDWAARLVGFWGPDEERIASELTSVASVLSAELADVLLVSAPPLEGEGAVAVLHRRMLAELGTRCTVVDLGDAAADRAA